MKSFKFEAKKFSTNETYFINDFLVDDHKYIAKFLMSGNDRAIWSALSDTLGDLSGHQKLSYLDTILALLKIKVLCIAPSKIKLNVVCPETKKKFETTVDITTVYNNYYGLLERLAPKIIENDLFKIVIHHPFQKEYTDDTTDTAIGAINSIEIRGMKTNINMTELTTEERRAVYYSLPAGLSEQITETVLQFERELNSFKFITLHSPYHRETKIELSLSLKMSSAMELLKIVFALDLSNHYNQCYCLSRDIGFSLTEIGRMTPSELSVYWKQYQEQISQNQSQPTNKMDVPTREHSVI